ncbi:MAG TPA: RagB/SusD family nutrient uptake outer membrane protein, partial [Bacteroidales bacterium]|nr:RagB/SusD family nutrient uptake outer membrane protein [Bacteroidales bacterium]
GGMVYLVHAAIGGSMNPAEFGVGGGWGGTRTTKAFVEKFYNDGDTIDTRDSRAMFHTAGQNLEINDVGTFTDGYAIKKFKNVTSTGDPAPHAHPDYVDTDFPMFRLADVYLMYAEATLRGGAGGSRSKALEYVNALRTRAYNGQTIGNITDAQLTLDFILDERARELYWEGHRRTDLIRFGKFSGGSYIWPWKGKVKEGTATPSHLDLFPIPSSDLNANPNLKQNPGY